MAERCDIAIRVISTKGTCDAEHKVGQNWVMGIKTPEGICMTAFNAIHPYLCWMVRGETRSDTITVGCPDVKNQIVFELKRLQK